MNPTAKAILPEPRSVKKAISQTPMITIFDFSNKIALLFRFGLLVVASFFVAGCGSIHDRHVLKFEVPTTGMSDLHGSGAIDLKAGECSKTDQTIGKVGMANAKSVIANMTEWTGATVEAIKKNISARGATVTAGAPKVLTITMVKAEAHQIPWVATGKIWLRAVTPEGLDNTFQGSSSSISPISSVDGAAVDAVKKLLQDPKVEAYLKK